MSRIYFLSKIKDYFKDKGYKLRENILLLIDKNLSQIAIHAKAVTSILNELIERQTEVRRQLTELAKNNNDINKRIK